MTPDRGVRRDERMTMSIQAAFASAERVCHAPVTIQHILHTAIILAAATAVSLPCRAQEAASAKCPPPATKGEVVDTYFGVRIPDPYRWLEDQNSPETRAWIEAEDKCTDAAIRNLPSREGIRTRLGELMKVESVDIPYERNGYYFFAKRAADQDLFVIYMRHGKDGTDEALVDPHPLSTDHSTSVQLAAVAPDASTIAYEIRSGGQDETTVHFRDTNTREDLGDSLPKAVYFEVSFTPDKKGVYYARTTESGPRVFYHAMGTDPARDKLIFGEGYGKDKIIFEQLSDDGKDLLISLVYGTGSTRADLYYADLKNGGAVKPIVNDTESVFFGEIQDGKAFIQTNWKAPHWRVLSADLNDLSKSAWKEIVPETEASIENVHLLGSKIFVQYVKDATSEEKIFDTDGKPEATVALPSLGTISGWRGYWDQGEAFYQFESLNVPESVFRYDVKEKKSTVWAAPKIAVDSSQYSVEQAWYESKDKTRVPMFLLYKKDLKKDGQRPVLMTGYGGFDVNLTPGFAATAIVWADAGGVFAQPTLRGGGEFGEAWHHAGMRENKQNVFDDFIAAGEWLIANGYTNPQKLAIEGSSNGGLLVGAALTQRPDLFKAVVCAYPLLDMLRYQKFEDGLYWVPEYGSSEDEAQFKYLLAYSPYQNVKDGRRYPAVLFITGDGDTRVAPLHARKMTARLQAAAGSDAPVLLLYDTKSGHSGGRPLGKQIEERTDWLSFLFWQLGMSGN
jgi:prolyl oligopeptidase